MGKSKVESGNGSENGSGNQNLGAIYQQLCTSYGAIDDFRAKLLGLLPLASAAGIFLVINQLTADKMEYLLEPIGAFGFAVTLGLFAYEIYGIKKCHALILAGKQIESALRVDGQFTHRPREVLYFINEPFAAGVIYPAVLAAWTYLALAFVLPGHGSGWVAFAVFLLFFALSMGYNYRLKLDGKRTEVAALNRRILEAEDTGDQATLDLLLADEFTLVRANGEKQDRQAFLAAVPANKARGRRADQVKVRLQDRDHAELICRVFTTCDRSGNLAFDRFENKQLFVRQNEEWRCMEWQVTGKPS